jgi:GNAT superfamily N-acetyltransferase
MSAYIVRSFAGAALPDAYRSMIFSRWLRSLRYGNDFFRLMEPVSYYRSYQRYITGILAHPDCVVHIAVLGEDHDVALGFAVTHGVVLDYVHVQKDMRRQGIAARLVPAHIERVTHLTRSALAIWGTKKHNWKFDPFA